MCKLVSVVKYFILQSKSDTTAGPLVPSSLSLRLTRHHRSASPSAPEVRVMSKSFSRFALLGAGLLAALTASSTAKAQVVRGVVVDEASGRAMPGTVVVLLDSDGKRLAGVLADESGRYAIRITVPGRYAVRAERIGYRSGAPTPVSLQVGETVELRLATRAIPVVLGEVRVSARSACVARASDGREVSAVWDEARKALYATDLTQQQELFTAKVSRFERTLDAVSGRVTGYQTTESSGVTRNPFVSVPAAQLAEHGFVRQGTGETIYYGPDAGVLLSDEFLRDHCFRLRKGSGEREQLIGLQFEPVAGRDKADISGTLWIDRKSAELRDLEYQYKNLQNIPSNVRADDFGGRVEFRRMPTGAWIVERWVIRMPVISDKGAMADRNQAVLPGSLARTVDRLALTAVREEGGEVRETIARGERSARASQLATLRGTVFDSTRMAPMPNARVFLDGTQFAARSGDDGRFAIEEVPEGTYTISVVHARFDSLDTRAPSLPVEAKGGDESSIALTVPSLATIFAGVCSREELAQGPGILRGVVRDGASAAPIPNAEVVVSWKRLGSATTVTTVNEPYSKTRSDSAGRYWVCGLPDGVRVTVRATGADALKSPPTDLIVVGGTLAVADLGVGAPPVSIAATSAVTTRPASGNRAMMAVERRRRRGGGAYLTRAEIERSSAQRLTDLLRQMPNVQVNADDNGRTIVELRRGQQFTYEPGRTGGAPDPGHVSVKHCPALFYIDGLPVDGSSAIDNTVRPQDLQIIEVYSHGQVPIEIVASGAECGVVLFWTRAFAERMDAPTND
jgi:hypothetical protein